MKLNCICLFFLKGYDHAFAGHYEPGFRGLAGKITPSDCHAESDCSQRQDILWGDALPIENDDDDDCTSVTKKTLGSRCTALNTIFFLSDLSHSSCNSRRYYERLDYLSHDRYIFYRVLRVWLVPGHSSLKRWCCLFFPKLSLIISRPYPAVHWTVARPSMMTRFIA